MIKIGGKTSPLKYFFCFLGKFIKKTQKLTLEKIIFEDKNILKY